MTFRKRPESPHLRYKWITIWSTVAGGEHLLPAHSDSRVAYGNRKIGNVMAHTEFHKFEVDSSIDWQASFCMASGAEVSSMCLCSPFWRTETND
jgi:hypothetical protein